MTCAAAALIVAFFTFATAAELDTKAGLSVDAVFEKMQSTTVFSARFTQDKYFSSVDEKVEFSGMVCLLRPGMARWIYEAPDASDILLNDEWLYNYVPELSQVNKVRLTDNPELKALFTAFFEYTAAQVHNKFIVRSIIGQEVLEKGAARFSLRPVDQDLRQKIESIELEADEGNLLPSRVIVIHANGDKTDTRFYNVKTGAEAGLSREFFKPEYPPDTVFVTEKD